MSALPGGKPGRALAARDASLFRRGPDGAPLILIDVQQTAPRRFTAEIIGSPLWSAGPSYAGALGALLEAFGSRMGLVVLPPVDAEPYVRVHRTPHSSAMRGRIVDPRLRTDDDVAVQSLCSSCVNSAPGTTPSGRRCTAGAPQGRLLEAGNPVGACAAYQDATGRRQLVDPAGPIRPR